MIGFHVAKLRPFVLSQIGIALISTGLATQASGQKVEAIRSAVFTPDPPAQPAAQPSRDDERMASSRSRRDARTQAAWMANDRDDDSESLSEFGWRLAGQLTYGILIGNPRHQGYDITYEASEAWDPESGRESTSDGMYFAHFPYADGHDGYTMLAEDLRARPLTAAFQAQFSHGRDFDDLAWWTTEGLFESSRSRLGLDASWTYFRETPAGQPADEFHLGDVNVLWRRFQTDRLLFRWGLGMAWYHDRVGTETGLNGTARFDYFLSRPCVISGELDLGKVGSATLQHGRLGVGTTWKHAELFAAFDYRRFDQIEVAGPLLGLRFWW